MKKLSDQEGNNRSKEDVGWAQATYVCKDRSPGVVKNECVLLMMDLKKPETERASKREEAL